MAHKKTPSSTSLVPPQRDACSLNLSNYSDGFSQDISLKSTKGKSNLVMMVLPPSFDINTFKTGVEDNVRLGVSIFICSLYFRLLK